MSERYRASVKLMAFVSIIHSVFTLFSMRMRDILLSLENKILKFVKIAYTYFFVDLQHPIYDTLITFLKLRVCLLVKWVLVHVNTTIFDSRNPHHLFGLHAVLPLRRNSVIFFAFDCYSCNLKSIKFGFSVTKAKNWFFLFSLKIHRVRLSISSTRSIVWVSTLFFCDTVSYKHTYNVSINQLTFWVSSSKWPIIEILLVLIEIEACWRWTRLLCTLQLNVPHIFMRLIFFFFVWW